ncbi:SDR family oxidoreductase [Paenibacillus sp. S3N08]|uniref:SDR family oxidoreductase n=1 Tax=Paenibacillus agricola TaxID=2716264 RepID=A0ABX0J7U7_9BACL|nr:SDR family oxidoreductase [Paenibacillus agricola]
MNHQRIMIVTGANSGMGLATTIALAKEGCKVIMVCRSRERGATAYQGALKQSGSSDIELMHGDLGSLESTRTFARAFKAKYSHLDGLINNAGVVAIKRQTTEDGFEVQLGVNHLGHFLLTRLLLDELQRAPQGRVVVVSSGAHKVGSIYWDDPFFTQGYSFWKGYAQSKLANILFTKELARRLQGTRVTVNSLHPGAVGTSLGVNRKTGFGKSILAFLGLFFLTPEEGAQTALYLATSEEVAGISGEYFYKKKIAPVSAKAQDAQQARLLWEWSEQQVGL